MSNTKWRSYFLVSTIFGVFIISLLVIQLALNSISMGHMKDNYSIIQEDLKHISKSIAKAAKTIEEFDEELLDQGVGHSLDRSRREIRLQLVTIIFDENNNFKLIKS